MSYKKIPAIVRINQLTNSEQHNSRIFWKENMINVAEAAEKHA